MFFCKFSETVLKFLFYQSIGGSNAIHASKKYKESHVYDQIVKLFIMYILYIYTGCPTKHDNMQEDLKVVLIFDIICCVYLLT